MLAEVANLNVVGNLSSTDEDVADRHSYSIIPGGDAAQNKLVLGKSDDCCCHRP